MKKYVLCVLFVALVGLMIAAFIFEGQRDVRSLRTPCVEGGRAHKYTGMWQYEEAKDWNHGSYHWRECDDCGWRQKK